MPMAITLWILESTGDGDYYFTYNNTLYMVLNTSCLRHLPNTRHFWKEPSRPTLMLPGKWFLSTSPSTALPAM